MIQPVTAQEFAVVLAEANVYGRAVAPQGGGTKLAWGNRASKDTTPVSTARMNRVIEHAWADMTVTVEAGCTVAALQATLAQHKQRMACDPLWPERATIGGILATNDSGVLRMRYGGLRDLIIGITVVLPDGTIASSGGKVVKNVAGYDLPKLMTGALGTLGVITQAVFRLHPLPQSSRTVRLECGSLGEAQKRLLEITSSQMAFGGIVWHGTSLYVLLEGTERYVETAGHKLGGIACDAPQRESLWPGEVVKFSVLPSRIGDAMAWTPGAIAMGTGIGYARLNGVDAAELRRKIEAIGGSLVRLTQSGSSPIDAWGDAGDALPLMRALKAQFDPKGTLNPGRYVGGI